MGQTMLTVALPIALAWMMYCVGLTLSLADFKRVGRYPLSIFSGLVAQLAGLPLIALALIHFLGLPEVVAVGLWLLALAPGGASSNVITHLSGGNTALSISMTAVSSVVIPFSLPLLLPVVLSDSQLVLPVKTAILQLVMVTLVPVTIGMVSNHVGRGKRFASFAKWAGHSSVWVLMFTVAITLAVNSQVFQQLFSSASVVAVALCLLGMALGAIVARLLNGGPVLTTTLAIEVGIQNAGTAIFVAVVQLGQPELALTPLLYGVLMNIPVAVMIYRYQRGRLRSLFAR
ncbi:bile acid:sodium symporter family protein [Photobacterium lutimaris]|uniref:Na(+)-dependent transporter n=1 Tax=Photobacterium lutimaris TaxID=388278 RepID=A0A2T3IVJ4_9GAMM|nr:bile acid:sodium symporter [Photobacterium lutimaris]PSU32420.1 Na(+)-dependent transporter [Photobacterium lutimaris]TDR77621.1 BASS family bile acid:Na+ symporter [Photobacterium lutimaris]